MIKWQTEFKKEKGIDNDSYLQEFLAQAESNISGLSIDTTIDEFESKLPNWNGYKGYYNTDMFITRGAYMDIDTLVDIHESTNHELQYSYEPTENSVYDVYRGESDDYYPIIPFVLNPVNFMYLNEDSEKTITYEILKEGRSRLAGVVKAREDGYFSGNSVPVVFAIRRTRR